MESTENISPKKKIINDRLRFLAEVVIVFIGIFLFLLIPRILVPFIINENSFLFGPVFYSLRALAVFLAIPILLFIFNLVFEFQKKNVVIEEELSPATAYLKLYSIPKEGFKNQLLYGVLLLFIIFIPLDFLIYFIFPEMLEYTAVVLTSQKTDSYLLANYSIFLISVIIIQISVAFYEESVTRGFLTQRGGEYYNKMSAVIISSLYFGLMHFAYFLNPASKNYPIWWPFIWFLNTLLVGILLSIFILKKKSIFPLIFAHALNNIISAHAVWNYTHGVDFNTVTIYLYLPLLIFSLILFIWQFSRIKHGIITGFDTLKSYFKRDERLGESKGDITFRIFFDFVIGVIILIIGILLI